METVGLSHETKRDRPQLVEPLNLDLDYGDLTVVLRHQHRTPAHINTQELCALLRYIKWRLRTCKNYARRFVILSDSQAALQALQKGRSSSHPTNIYHYAAPTMPIPMKARRIGLLYETVEPCNISAAH